MLLIVGVSANLRASIAIGLHASTREAPKAKNTSTLSLFSLHVVSMHVEYERANVGFGITRLTVTPSIHS